MPAPFRGEALPSSRAARQTFAEGVVKWCQSDSLTVTEPALPPSSLVGRATVKDAMRLIHAEYVQFYRAAFMKAGACGMAFMFLFIFFLFASGDQGVCGRVGCNFPSKRFLPDLPAASPYITAVGDTTVTVGGAIGDETMWSGDVGGLGDNLAIPSWQEETVAAYKKNPVAKLPPQAKWNNTGRGYPCIKVGDGR